MPGRAPQPPPRRIAVRAACACACASVMTALSLPALAQTPVMTNNPAGPPSPAYEESPPPRPRRPPFLMAIGMGTSYETAGLARDRTEQVPAFFAMLGAGTGLLGFEIGVFASSAMGRFRPPDLPLDRLAVSASGVVRPFMPREGRARRGSYADRLLAGFGAEVGLAFERDARTREAGTRFGLHTGAHLRIPLSPAAEATQLALRLGTRHMLGFFTPLVGDTAVGNTTEIYAALSVEM